MPVYASFRRGVRDALLTLSHHAGLLGLLRRRRMRDRALILLYHRVAPAGDGAPDYSTAGMVVTPAEFETQMRFLRRAYQVVPLSRIVDVARGAEPLSPRLAAVTFDDGWRDVYQHALPVLRRHGIPATLFVATGPVDGGPWFWEERAKYLLACLSMVPAADVAGAAPDPMVEGWRRDLAGLPAEQLAQRLVGIVAALRSEAADARDRHLSAVERLIVARDAAASRPFMTWAQARALAAGGVSLGNHTASHVDLRQVPGEVAVDEVDRAGRRLAAEGADPEAAAHFAYPYGSHDAGVRAAVQRAGAISACTAKTGYVTRGTDVFQLDRVNICSRSAPTEAIFAARMLGLC
jgi:peptidoglycan/xylan/chitin deacetylase (PgdA/CDA1 family)